MAFTYRLYNHTSKLLLNQQANLAGLRVMLLAATAPAFDPAHTTLDEAAGVGAAHEVHGNGWTQGGEPIANAVVSVVGGNDTNLVADDISVRAAGGSIGPASAYVAYYDAGAGVLVPLFHCDFGPTPQEAGDTTEFKVRWHPDGIVRLDYTLPT